MDVILMMDEVLIIPNPVIRESALPDLAFSSDDFSQSVRISAFDELHGVLECHVLRWSKEQMDVFRHHNEGVDLKAAFTAIAIESL